MDHGHGGELAHLSRLLSCSTFAPMNRKSEKTQLLKTRSCRNCAVLHPLIRRERLGLNTHMFFASCCGADSGLQFTSRFSLPSKPETLSTFTNGDD